MKPNHHLLIQTYENTLSTLSESEIGKLLDVLKRTGRGRPSTYKSVRLERGFLSRFEGNIKENCKGHISEEKLNKIFNELASINFDDNKKNDKPDEINFTESVEKSGLNQTEAFRFTVIVYSLYFRQYYTEYIKDFKGKWNKKYTVLPSIIDELIDLRIQNEISKIPEYVEREKWKFFFYSYFSVSYESSCKENEARNAVKDSNLRQSWIKKQSSPDRRSLCNLAIILRWSEDELNRILNCCGHRTLVLRNPESVLLQWILVHNRESENDTPFIEYVQAYCAYKIELVKSLYDNINNNIRDGVFDDVSSMPLLVFPFQYNFLPSEHERKISKWNSAWKKIDSYFNLEFCNQLREEYLFYEETDTSEFRIESDKRIEVILGPYNPKRNGEQRKNIKRQFYEYIETSVSLDEIAFKCKDLSEQEYLVLKPVFDFESTCDYGINDIDFLICLRSLPRNDNGYEYYKKIQNSLHFHKSLRKTLEDMQNKIIESPDLYVSFDIRQGSSFDIFSEEDKRLFASIANLEMNLDFQSQYEAKKSKILNHCSQRTYRKRYEKILNNALFDCNKRFIDIIWYWNDRKSFETDLIEKVNHCESAVTYFLDKIQEIQSKYCKFSRLRDNNGSNDIKELLSMISSDERERLQLRIKDTSEFKEELFSIVEDKANIEIDKLFEIRKVDSQNTFFISDLFDKLALNFQRKDKYYRNAEILREAYYERVCKEVFDPVAKLICINNYRTIPLYNLLLTVSQKSPALRESSAAFTTICLNLIDTIDDPKKFAQELSNLSNQFDINRESSRRETARLLLKLWTKFPYRYDVYFDFADIVSCIWENESMKREIIEQCSSVMDEEFVPDEQLCFLLQDAFERIFYKKAEPSILLLKILSKLTQEQMKEIRKNAKLSAAELEYEKFENVLYYEDIREK